MITCKEITRGVRSYAETSGVATGEGAWGPPNRVVTKRKKEIKSEKSKKTEGGKEKRGQKKTPGLKVKYSYITYISSSCNAL